MTVKILMKEQIKSWVLRVLSGYCFNERRPSHPKILILSPWIGDVQLELDKDVGELDEWLNNVYGIGSINLPYAFLVLKLDFGADIDIVTLPPTGKHYHERASSAKVLLDFLDEIGCDVYINPDLHSKLILSNDMALLGSFNLSFSALWGREEIGVSIDDIETLKTLEHYAHEVIASSEPYGYTSNTRRQAFSRTNEIVKEQLRRIERYGYLKEGESIWRKPISSVTRGWLLEKLLERGDFVDDLRYEIHEFFFFTFHPASALSYDLVRLAVSDLEAFYLTAFSELIKLRTELVARKTLNSNLAKEARLQFFRYLFNYQGNNETDEILNFLKTKFARTHIPKISPAIIPMLRQEE